MRMISTLRNKFSVKVKDITQFKNNNPNNTNHGYLFEVDLEYPRDLWKSYNDYPLAPEKIKIDNVEKLAGNFYPKFHYVLHYRNLKQFLSLGMKLKKVHRGISFYHSRWMEPYIKEHRAQKTSNKYF